MTVAAILKHKGTDVATVGPTRTIAEVARLLSSRRIGAVPVCDAEDRILGILSERDVMYALASHGAATLQMTARQLMTVTLHIATPDTTVDEALAAMTEGRFRHMPVIQHGRLIGIVSIGDVVKAKLMRQEAEVDGLRAYVAGST
jgi:CBS domain-containing protein